MKLSADRIKMLMLSVLAFVIVLGAHICRYVLPYNPFKTSMTEASLPPSAAHWFGTDNLGRDVFSRILPGSQTTLYASLCVVAVVFVIGTLLGVIAGYMGGTVDTVIIKIVVIFQAFPSFILAVAVSGMLGAGMLNGMLSLRAVYWTTYAKLSRSLVLQMKDADYIRAAKLCFAKCSISAGSYSSTGCRKCNTKYGRIIFPWSGSTASNCRVGSYDERGKKLYADSAMDHYISRISFIFDGNCI